MANPFVSSVISTAPVGASRQGFGVPMLLSYNASAFGSERLRYYTGTDEVLEDFPSTTGPEMRAATALFGQSVRPERIAIGRGALPPTQAYALAILSGLAAGQAYRVNVKGDGVTDTDITVTALADITISAVTNASETFTAVAHGMATGDGPYRLTNSGGGLPSGTAADTNYWIIKLTADTFQLASSYANAIALTPVAIASDGTGTHTVQRDANDVIVAQLVDRLNSVVGKNFTAAQVTGSGDTDTLTVTASAAGEWFSIEVPDADLALLSVAQTHADPGVATDLAAIAQTEQEWYCLLTAYNSQAYVMAAAAWIETQNSDPRRIYHAACCNSLGATAATGGAGNDILDRLKTAAYARTTGFYATAPAAMIDGAVSGRVLPKLPGSVVLPARPLVGAGLSVSLTTTQRANLDAKNANYYRVISGVGALIGGKTASGEWWDVVRNDDSVNVDMIASHYDAARANDIVLYDDDGISSKKGVTIGVLQRAVDAGIYLPGFTVTSPTRANATSANVAARRVPISWAAQRAGAIIFIDATGTVS